MIERKQNMAKPTASYRRACLCVCSMFILWSVKNDFYGIVRAYLSTCFRRITYVQCVPHILFRRSGTHIPFNLISFSMLPLCHSVRHSCSVSKAICNHERFEFWRQLVAAVPWYFAFYWHCIVNSQIRNSSCIILFLFFDFVLTFLFIFSFTNLNSFLHTI